MAEPFKYGSCALYLTPVWVNLPSDPEVALLLKPFSHYELSSFTELNYYAENNPEFSTKHTIRTLLSPLILDHHNLLDFPDSKSITSQLSNEDITFLYERIMEISVVTDAQIEALSDMIGIQFNPQFQEDSWDCKMCQEKKLDYSRGCGFLPEDKRDPTPLLPRIAGKRFTVCPISTINGYATRQASLAYGFMEAGVLPEEGGLGSQTEWFVRAALLYKRKIAEAERAVMDAHKTK